MRPPRFWLDEPSVLLARAVLFVLPILSLSALKLPGIVTLSLVLPVAVLLLTGARHQAINVPLWGVPMIAIFALSVLWSDDPTYSAERLRTYLPALIATLTAASQLTGRQILGCIRASFAFIVLSSLVVLVVDPSTRHNGDQTISLIAQFPKNAYGAVLVFSLALVLAHHDRRVYYFLPGLIALIALNRAVTGWLVAVMIIALALLGRWISARLGTSRAVAPLACGGVALATLAATLLAVAGTSVFALVGKDPTLSARTKIWSACWEQIQRAPLLGHGAYTFLDAASSSPVTLAVWARFAPYQPPHPHNGLLDLWGQLGLVGVLVFVGLIISGFRAAAARVDRDPEVAATCVLGLLVILVFGLTEPLYAGPWLILTLMLVAMVTSSRASHIADANHLQPGAAVVATAVI